MTPTPLLMACTRQKTHKNTGRRGSEDAGFGNATKEANMATYPKLAAHAFVGFDETILMVHHDTILLFTSGVVTERDGDRLFLLQ